MKRAFLLNSLLAVTASMLLACGGGSGGDDTDTSSGSGSSGGSAGSSSALYAAYNKIGAGMNLAKVSDIVGYAPNNGESHYADRSDYQWIAEKGTSNVTILSVSINTGKGVTFKIVNGANGRFSQSY